MKPSELKDILEQHHLWVESDYKQGERANLHGADLRGVNLHGANLHGANLDRADLRGATFDLNFKQVGWFIKATFSENQIAWVCLHPKFHEWADTLKWVKAEATAA